MEDERGPNVLFFSEQWQHTQDKLHSFRTIKLIDLISEQYTCFDIFKTAWSIWAIFRQCVQTDEMGSPKRSACGQWQTQYDSNYWPSSLSFSLQTSICHLKHCTWKICLSVQMQDNHHGEAATKHYRMREWMWERDGGRERERGGGGIGWGEGGSSSRALQSFSVYIVFSITLPGFVACIVTILYYPCITMAMTHYSISHQWTSLCFTSISSLVWKAVEQTVKRGIVWSG